MATVRMSLEAASDQRFPRICVCTGEHATDDIKLGAYRTPMWAYLLLLLGVVPGLVAIAAARRTYPSVELALPVSDGVSARRRDRIVLAGTSAIGGMLLIAVGAMRSIDFAVWFGIALSIGALALVVLALRIPGVRAQVTRKQDVVLDHVHERFAAALQERPTAASRSRRRRSA